MLNNFIYAETKALFQTELESGNILNEAIVFLADTGEIWTHGSYFGTKLSAEEVDNLVTNSETIQEFINNLIDNKAEVYIGDTEPTNGEKIWIDSSEATPLKVVEEAPLDGNQYVRQNGEWTTIDIVDLLSYGVEWDTTVADPDLIRIGNPLLHKSLPIQSALKGCLWKDGAINYYLDNDDWSKKADGSNSVLDGTDGTVRVHVPKFYGRSWVEGNKRRVRISTTQIDPSWIEIPECVIDAYRCTIDRTDPNSLKAVSVVNSTANFRGGSNDSSVDSTVSTQLGKPATNVTRANMRTYARNASSELLDYETYKWIFYWLPVIEYATFNMQQDVNSELTPAGYHQGGLGAGLTNWTYSIWIHYNRVNPISNCGVSNSLGNNTGQVSIPAVEFSNNSRNHTTITNWINQNTDYITTSEADNILTISYCNGTRQATYIEWPYAVGSFTFRVAGLGGNITSLNIFGTTVSSNGDITVNMPATNESNRYINATGTGSGSVTVQMISAASNTSVTKTTTATQVARWRGFENVFGDIWTNLDGIILERTAADQPSTVYATSNPDLYGDDQDAKGNMTAVGTEIAQNGYIKDFDLGETGEIIPSAVGGSTTTTYMCDYHYCNPEYTQLRTLLVGGRATDGGNAGLGYFASTDSVSSRHSFVGFRTMNKL